jgi:hypothetical protein
MTSADVDWGNQLICVRRKGTGAPQWLGASPESFVWLRLYQASGTWSRAARCGGRYGPHLLAAGRGGLPAQVLRDHRQVIRAGLRALPVQRQRRRVDGQPAHSRRLWAGCTSF